MPRPEVLAPAGSAECLRAAVAGGADAVYLGLRHFNARGRAQNFRLDDLPAQVDWLHQHGLKCYVVLNTLLHDDELPKALRMAAAAHEAGVDAAIIQDLGLWTELAKAVPGLKRHASTQMTVHDPAQVAVLARLGAERVIVARELSLGELTACVRTAQQHHCQIEHFVHGALCYAYSGQCLMSNFAGCRSANRGTCAQNCRFDYTKDAEAEAETHISMKDMALIAHVGELASAGVASFKIEGRLKSPAYVYQTSRLYRQALEAWAAGRPFDAAAARRALATVFSRGHTDAWLNGDSSAAGRVTRYHDDGEPDATLVHIDRREGLVVLRSATPPHPGMGFRCTVGQFNDGFLVIGVDADGRPETWRCRVRVAERGPFMPAGTALFINVDQAVQAEAAKAMRALSLPRERESGVVCNLQVSGAPGQPLHITAITFDGRAATVSTDVPAQLATGQALDHRTLRESLGALGGTGFVAGAIEVEFAGQLFVPAASLKRARRVLVDGLLAQPPQIVTEGDDDDAPAAEPIPDQAPVPVSVAAVRERAQRTALWVAVRDAAAARAALDAGAEQVWLDDPTLDLWGGDAPRLAGVDAVLRRSLWLRHPATARVSPHLKTIGLGVVAGQLGALAAAKAAGLPTIADTALNVVNSSTVRALGVQGAQAAVISLELSCREVAKLVGRVDAAAKLGLVVHGRVPAMLARQDHGLAIGQQQRITATARDGGLAYDLQRRAAGDTVVWEARRLCSPSTVRLTAGLVAGWVLELADLDAAAVGVITTAYAKLRDGTIEPSEVEIIASAHAADGFFAGHLDTGSRALDTARAIEDDPL